MWECTKKFVHGWKEVIEHGRGAKVNAGTSGRPGLGGLCGLSGPRVDGITGIRARRGSRFAGHAFLCNLPQSPEPSRGKLVHFIHSVHFVHCVHLDPLLMALQLPSALPQATIRLWPLPSFMPDWRFSTLAIRSHDVWRKWARRSRGTLPDKKSSLWVC